MTESSISHEAEKIVNKYKSSGQFDEIRRKLLVQFKESVC